MNFNTGVPIYTADVSYVEQNQRSGLHYFWVILFSISNSQTILFRNVKQSVSLFVMIKSSPIYICLEVVGGKLWTHISCYLMSPVGSRPDSSSFTDCDATTELFGWWMVFCRAEIFVTNIMSVYPITYWSISIDQTVIWSPV